MKNSVCLRRDTFDGLREIGGFGQPLHALYPQIRMVLTTELGPAAGELLAEPVVDRANNRIEWYAEADPDQQPVALLDLPVAERSSIFAQVEALLTRGRELAEQYAVSEDPRKVQLGAILQSVLVTPAQQELFLVEGKPLITGWGFAPDRPWDVLGESSQSSHAVSEQVSPPSRDVVVPEVAIPELTALGEPGQPPGSADHEQEGGEPISPPSPDSVSNQPPTTSPANEREERILPASQREAPDEAATVTSGNNAPSADQIASELPQSVPPTTTPGLVRYVVVGSRYFWTVAILALLLALLAAAYWFLNRDQTATALANAGQTTATDADLADAQQTEAELRDRLAQLQAQLTERRSLCEKPDQAGADSATRSTPAQGSRVDGTVLSGSVSESEKPSLPVGKGETRSTDRAVAASSATQSATLPGQIQAGSDAPSPTPQPGSSAPASQDRIDSSPAQDHAGPPTAEDRTSDGRPDLPTATTRQQQTDLPTLSARQRSTEQALEDALAAPPLPATESSQSAPSQPAPPPVKAAPTAEEQQEFANRMSATGATVGEITATLLWNNHGDLDLVVRCPSGQRLDFRNPAECGGTLDVDANMTRAQLSDRPVENAFWPAGKAAKGSYEIIVRYVPRKDEEKPQETPFQVRLSQAGEESVFKGTIRPNAAVSVTRFTVPH